MTMMRRIFLAGVAASATVPAVRSGHATLRQPPTFGGRFELADRVVMARIDESERIADCGTRYRGTVERWFKRDATAADEAVITFGRSPGLEKDTTYLL